MKPQVRAARRRRRTAQVAPARTCKVALALGRPCLPTAGRPTTAEDPGFPPGPTVFLAGRLSSTESPAAARHLLRVDRRVCQTLPTPAAAPTAAARRRRPDHPCHLHLVI